MLYTQKTILVVEDEPALRHALEQKLENEGYTLQSARDGEEALKLLKKDKPSLVVLDILLPKIDGVAVLHEIRNMYPELPVIILTNLDANDELLKHVVDDHPAYYLVKAETGLSDLATKIDEILTTE